MVETGGTIIPISTRMHVNAEWRRISEAAEVILPEPNHGSLAKAAAEGLAMGQSWRDIRYALRLVIGATSPLQKYRYRNEEDERVEFEYQEDIRVGKASRESVMMYYIMYMGGGSNSEQDVETYL